MSSVVPGHELVVNFAAERHVDRSIDGASAFVRTAVAGVQVLLGACLAAQVPRVVQVSTDEVYGSVANGFCAEDAPLVPSSPYAAAKASGDLIGQPSAPTHGLNISITRCCNNYGPYRYREKITPLFITNLLDGLPVPLYGNNGNVRCWVHVDDHCRRIHLVAERSQAGEIHHINGNAELNNRDLTGMLLHACGANWNMVTGVADRKGHDRRYALDDTLLRTMGYRPRMPFADGLANTVSWYQRHRSGWEPLKQAQP